MSNEDIGDNTGIDITLNELVDVLTDCNDKQKVISEATGKLRNAIKGHLESHALNKEGLALIRKIDAKSPTARADMLRTFHTLYNLMFKAKWGTELQDMLTDLEERAEEENSD